MHGTTMDVKLGCLCKVMAWYWLHHDLLITCQTNVKSTS